MECGGENNGTANRIRRKKYEEVNHLAGHINLALHKMEEHKFVLKEEQSL